MMDENKMQEALPSLADADAKELALACRDILESKKGSNVVVLSVEGRSDITDYLGLATGTSGPHVKALADELEYRLSLRDVHPLHADGVGTRSWQIVDFGIVMVHVFDRESREFFNLDKLYKETTEE